MSTLFPYTTLFRSLVGLNVAISIVKWLIMATMYYTAFAAVGAAIGFEPAATIPVVSSLVAYIPITVAGLGTTEWTAVGLFAAAGVDDRKSPRLNSSHYCASRMPSSA